MIFRRRILCEFLSQLSCDYTVDIFFLLISLIKSCVCDSWQWNSKELQALSGMLQTAHILLLTQEIVPSLIWEIRSAYIKKCFSLHASCALTVSWPQDLTCTQLHRLYIAQKGRGVYSRAEDLTSKFRESWELQQNMQLSFQVLLWAGIQQSDAESLIKLVCIIPLSKATLKHIFISTILVGISSAVSRGGWVSMWT